MHASSAAHPISPPPQHLPSGFTLVELLVATAVLAVGLLALTSAGAATVKLGGRGQQLSTIASLGETRLELLRANRCASASGASSSGDLDERWRLEYGPTSTRVLIDSIAPTNAKAPRLASYTFRSAVPC